MGDQNKCEVEDSLFEDIKLFIETIKYQQDKPELQEQALKTMASILHTHDEGSRFLLRLNGLDTVLNVLNVCNQDDKPNSLKEACLHVLCAACENNGTVQKALCTEKIFVLLKTLLAKKSSLKLKTLSCYLLICLIRNNENGQCLVRETKCLEKLSYLFKDAAFPFHSPQSSNKLPGIISFQNKESEDYTNFWQTVANALSVSINNPQRRENQDYCLRLFPVAICYLRKCDSSLVQTTTLTFLTNCLSHNNRCQVSFRIVGGLRTLFDNFNNEMLSTDQASSSLLKSLMLTIEAAVCGNDLARDNVAEMKGVPLLLKSLHSSFLSPSFKVQCLITIAALIEECEPSCEQFVSNNGMSIVVKILAESQNCEELQKSAICVLHTYLEQTKSMPALLMNNEFNAKLSRDNETKTYKDTFSADVVEDEKVTVSCVTDKIEDLTNEVRILKQLFTSKEKLIQKPVAADIVKPLMKGINIQNDSARDEDNLEQITEIVEDIVIGVSSSTSQKQIALVEPKKSNETAISHINETGNFREISPSRNEDFLELNSVLPVNSTQSKAEVGDRIDEAAVSDVMEIAKRNSLIKPGEMQDNNPKSPIDSNVTCLDVSTHFKNVDTSFHKGSISCYEYPTSNQSLSQMDNNEVSSLNSNVDNNEILVKAGKERRTDLGKEALNVLTRKCRNSKKIALVNVNESTDAVVALTKLKTACIKKKRELEIVDENEECCSESANIAENIVDESKKKSELAHPKVVERTYDVLNTKREVNKECLGCLCDFTKVNSRNFLSNMRSNPTMCSEHRLFAINIATARRRYHKYLMTKKESPNFNFVSSPKMNAHHINIPHEKTGRSHPEQKNVRRPKVPFSTYEIEVLKKGVEKYGPRFNLIERYCEFSTKRSAKTLKQKYESLNVPYYAKKKKRCPFSLQEEDNLKAGVSRFGYKWTCIMEHYEFKKGRTPQDLKDKWRNLLKSS